MDANDPILELVASIARIEAKLEIIDKGVNGNGMPGLKQKVEDLEASKNRAWGVGSAVVFIAGIVEWFIHKR